MPSLFLSLVLYLTLIDWLIFKVRNLIGLLEFHIALSPNQLFYNLSLIKLCAAYAKQNAAVNASGASSLLAK